MSKYQTIYSLRELHNLLKDHDKKDDIMVWFDIDLTLVQPHPKNEEIDILIEPKVTRELFDYIRKHNIGFSFITARFYDIVCNSKKRDLNAIKKNIVETIFPFLEELGLNVDEYKLKDDLHIIKSDKGKCVGIVYKGIIFSGFKGPSIKNFNKEFGFDKTRSTHIFIDDHDTYLNSVARHVPSCLILRREIE